MIIIMYLNISKYLTNLHRLQTACIEIAQCIKFQNLKNDNICQKISFSNYRKIVEGTFENYERKLASKTKESERQSGFVLPSRK